jgi:hypothetical protein
MNPFEALTEVRLVERSWMQELHDGLTRDASPFRIICPFIKDSVLAELLERHGPAELLVITRFRLADFLAGVSDIAALRRILQAGGKVRGIRGLHAKLFLFGETRAAVTSANLTTRGMRTNHEFGCVSEERGFVTACSAYFDKLWSSAGNDLQLPQLDQWETDLDQFLDTGGRPGEHLALPDHGAAVPGVSSSSVDDWTPEGWPADSAQFFVKFFGQGSNRAPHHFPVIEEVARTGCHWACTYPADRRPRSVRDGDTMFLARLARDPDDTLIFGRAIARAHREGHDDAAPPEVAARPWKKTWPHYIRVHHAEFVAGDLGNGVSLRELMTALGPDSFVSTQTNRLVGSGNIDPRLAVRQQPAVRLTDEAAAWLTARLEQAFVEHGRIPPGELHKLDWPEG